MSQPAQSAFCARVIKSPLRAFIEMSSVISKPLKPILFRMMLIIVGDCVTGFFESISLNTK